MLDAEGNSLTLVGQGSRVFLRTDGKQGQLLVRWGESPDRQCRVNYRMPKEQDKGDKPFQQAEAVCSRQAGRTEIAAR
ncbi:hypothetical protein D3C78_1719890 [compost metagenome]